MRGADPAALHSAPAKAGAALSSSGSSGRQLPGSQHYLMSCLLLKCIDLVLPPDLVLDHQLLRPLAQETVGAAHFLHQRGRQPWPGLDLLGAQAAHHVDAAAARAFIFGGGAAAMVLPVRCPCGPGSEFHRPQRSRRRMSGEGEPLRACSPGLGASPEQYASRVGLGQCNGRLAIQFAMETTVELLVLLCKRRGQHMRGLNMYPVENDRAASGRSGRESREP